MRGARGRRRAVHPELRGPAVPACRPGLHGDGVQVPWTRIDPWPAGIQALHEHGFKVAALALEDDSISLDDLVADPPDKLALVLGTEGDGLKARTIAECDMTVRIPMTGGVDSLNVASAVAVAAWATRVPDVES